MCDCKRFQACREWRHTLDRFSIKYSADGVFMSNPTGRPDLYTTGVSIPSPQFEGLMATPAASWCITSEHAVGIEPTKYSFADCRVSHSATRALLKTWWTEVDSNHYRLICVREIYSFRSSPALSRSIEANCVVV